MSETIKSGSNVIHYPPSELGWIKVGPDRYRAGAYLIEMRGDGTKAKPQRVIVDAPQVRRLAEALLRMLPADVTAGVPVSKPDTFRPANPVDGS